MDETQISITIRPVHIERLVYWLIIVALAILVVFLWLRDCEPSDTQNNGVTTPPTQNNNPPTTIDPDEEEDLATCVDGKKNQDETDVDCGGNCGSCVAGKSCKIASDCASNICTGNICTSTPAAPTTTLSGKVTLDLKNVVTQKSPSTNAKKAVRIDYTIENGLDEDLNQLTIKVFVKSAKSPSYCLNQQPEPGNDCSKPYAELLVSGPKSGKTLTESQSIEGKYILTEPSYYDADNTNLDNFIVAMYVYDSGGNEIDGKTLTDAFQVNT